MRVSNAPLRLPAEMGEGGSSATQTQHLPQKEQISFVASQALSYLQGVRIATLEGHVKALFVDRQATGRLDIPQVLSLIDQCTQFLQTHSKVDALYSHLLFSLCLIYITNPTTELDQAQTDKMMNIITQNGAAQYYMGLLYDPQVHDPEIWKLASLDQDRGVGRLYQHHNNTNFKDASKAAFRYRMAAESGNKNAQNQLIKLYLNNSEHQFDQSETAYLEKIAQQDSIPAQVALAQHRYSTKKYPQAFPWYSRAAEANHPLALAMMGRYYHTGRGGVTKNDETAADYYRRAAEASRKGLGGVPSNINQANEWDQEALRLEQNVRH